MIKLNQLLFLFPLFLFAILLACTSKSKQPTLVKNETKFKNVNVVESLKAQNTNKLISTVSKTLIITTWNIQDLGRTKDSLEIYQIAKIINNSDIVAIQEVVAKDPAGAQAIAKIAGELNSMGSKWGYSISNPTKSPSAHMSERYAFLWKTSKVTLVNKPYLDSELEQVIYRELYIAKFKLKKENKSFYVINYHSRKFNDKPEEEAIYLSEYPKRLKTDTLLILGDFNINAVHPIWFKLYKLGFKPALSNTPTTLKRKCKQGEYFNYAIDNIFYSPKQFSLMESGRIDFVKDCNNLEKARMLSDHLPVFMEFNLN